MGEGWEAGEGRGRVTKAALNCRLMHIHRLKAKRGASSVEEWRQLFIFKSILTTADRWAEGLGASEASEAAVRCASSARSAPQRGEN